MFRKNSVSEKAIQKYYSENLAARRFALAAICLGTTLGPLSLASVNIALPTIALELNASAIIVSWMPTGFLLATVMLMLPMGKLADRYGRKRFYFGGVACTGLLSIAASFGQSMEWILICRILQGASMSAVFGSGMAIVTSIYPANKRGAAMGLYSSSIYIGLTLSPVIGGWVTEWFGWRSVFWIQTPVALSVVIMLFYVKGEWRNPKKTRFDWTGALIFACWAASFSVGLSGLPNLSAILTLVLSCAFMWLFIYHQNRIEEPLIRPKMFRESRIFSFSLIAAVFMYGSSYPFGFLLSLFLQLSMGYSPSEAGTTMLVQAMVMACMAPFAGKLSDRFEARIISTTGCIIMCLGYFQIMRATYDVSHAAIFVGQILIGLGHGLFATPNTNAVMGSLNKAELGVGSSSVNLARTIGNLTGMSLVGFLIYIYIGDAEFTSESASELTSTLRIWMGIAMSFTIVAAVSSFSRGKMNRS